MPRFSRENAREMSARGNVVRWSRWRAAQPATATTSATPAPLPAPEQQYSATRLTRVRMLLDRLDQLLATETDPQKLDRLAAAADKLSQQECWLSGRPRPGVRKPTRATTWSRSELPPLTVPEPEPLPESSPVPEPVEAKPKPAQTAAAEASEPPTPAPNASRPTAPARMPAAQPALPARVPVTSVSSPLIQKTGPPPSMIRLPDGRLGYVPTFPVSANRP
jgi:hypothetical protein